MFPNDSKDERIDKLAQKMNEKVIMNKSRTTLENNPKMIKFYFLDPFHDENGNEDVIRGDISHRAVENIIIELGMLFEGKKIFFHVLTCEHYTWALNSPYDDVIIAYADESFTVEEAGKIFDLEGELMGLEDD